MEVSRRFFRKYYPDNRKSGTIFFYKMIRHEIKQGDLILNLGAGPGDSLSDEDFQIRDVRGNGWTILGCDPDLLVLSNIQINESKMMINPDIIPYESGYFDLIYSDYVLEHVREPNVFLKEVYRVLKPGKKFFFRTPNIHHYVTLGSILITNCLIANCFQKKMVSKAKEFGWNDFSSYPKYYRINSRKVLEKMASKIGFRNIKIVMFEGEPSYLLFNQIAFLIGVGYERIVNRFKGFDFLRANLIGFMVK